MARVVAFDSGATTAGAPQSEAPVSTTPVIGRFISVDPVHDGDDPQSWNNDAYTGDNSTTYSDPLGPRVTDACGHQRGRTLCRRSARGV
jgi:hypothetical protein